MKHCVCVLAAVAILFLGLAGCMGVEDAASFDSARAISVLTREDGSGTRGAFTELFGLMEEDETGQSVDQTTLEAEVTNSTSVVMLTVSRSKYSIGYLSLGSLHEMVKALAIDGAEATVENVQNGTYPIWRAFQIATREGISEVTQDFIAFILSDEGQQVVQESGYVPAESQGAFSTVRPKGKVVVSGSSSVTPVMEKLKEAYLTWNPNASIEIQQSDSSTGLASVISGICDIGMTSRALKDSEISQGLTSTVIAKDGIAVVVSPDNPVSGLTTEQVRKIFSGEIQIWSQLLDADGQEEAA